MNLVPNWRRVLLRAQSMWCVYIAAALQVLPYVSDHLPWWVPVAVLLAAPLFRIRDQGGLDGTNQ
jgi:hypothetical protein